MAYYQQGGGGGYPPQQRHPQQPMYSGGPPNYQAHMQHNMHHHGGGHQAHQARQAHQAHQARPMQQNFLKRQASQLRTQYPDTQWCAVYIDTTTTATQATSARANDYINENELLEPIPKTNTSGLDLTLEESVMNDVMTWQDKDASEAKRYEEQRKEIEQKRQEEKAAKEQKENDLITEYMSISGISDRGLARKDLEKSEWDLQKAVQQVNFSSPNIMGDDNNDGNKLNNYNGYNLGMNNNNNSPGAAYGGNYGNNMNGNSNSASLRLTLPNNESMNLDMQGSDTIWDLYAKLLQSRPEFSQKPFTFQLTDGHKLQETEFDTTLRTLKCVPLGEIKVVY